MSYSQLTNSIIFQRCRYTTNQLCNEFGKIGVTIPFVFTVRFVKPLAYWSRMNFRWVRSRRPVVPNGRWNMDFLWETGGFPWRIHGAAIYGAPWIPSIYSIPFMLAYIYQHHGSVMGLDIFGFLVFRWAFLAIYEPIYSAWLSSLPDKVPLLWEKSLEPIPLSVDCTIQNYDFRLERW